MLLLALNSFMAYFHLLATCPLQSMLNNLPTSDRVIMHGEVVQLDSDNMRPQHNVMLILLSDRLLIGQPSSGYISSCVLVCKISSVIHLYVVSYMVLRNVIILGKYRFQLESSHPLNNIAAVNIKDREMAKL